MADWLAEWLAGWLFVCRLNGVSMFFIPPHHSSKLPVASSVQILAPIGFYAIPIPGVAEVSYQGAGQIEKNACLMIYIIFEQTKKTLINHSETNTNHILGDG